MPVLRPAPRPRLQAPGLPLRESVARDLARAGWTSGDVRAVRDLCGDDTAQVLEDVLQDAWPDRTPATVLLWLRAGGRPLVEALRDPAQRARQVSGMQSWSRTFGELGPPAHAAGLGLREATHLLAQGELTAAALEDRARQRGPAPLQATWSDVLRAGDRPGSQPHLS